MYRRWTLILLALVSLSTTGCSTFGMFGTTPREPRYRVIAYVRGRAEIHRISPRKLTHINYAFAVVSKEGEIVFADEPAAASHLAQLQALKAGNPRLKILVSVGGWGADNFSDAAVDDAARQRFAASGIAMLKRYALDGLDLDWEYPGQPGPGIKFRAEDQQNFTFMLAELRNQLDALSDERGRRGADRYVLTIASAAGSHYFAHTEMDKLHRYLDWINIMTYDHFTGGGQTTGHHTNLYPYLGTAWPPSADAAVRQHLGAGIPARKLVIGAAFYGRGFAGANPDRHGLYQRYEKYVSDLPFAKLMREYVGLQGYTRYWDRKARAPYLWNEATRTFITYDDVQSVREKAHYVRRNRLGGVMYWEHSHDPEEVLLDAISRILR